MRTFFARLALAAIFLHSGTILHAELVYQPPVGTTLDQDWQRAGSQLFKSVAKINEALAELEVKRIEQAGQRLSEAQGLLKETTAAYSKIARSVTKPRVVSQASLPPAGQRRLDEMAKQYGIKVPSTESEAAQIASDETARLQGYIEKRNADVLKSNLAAVRDLLSEVTRLQKIGTATAELMTTVK